MKKIKFYKNIKEAKKKKNNNSLKKIQIKTSIEQWTIYIKDIIKVYIKRIEKDLGLKAFKHYFYTKHYVVALGLVQLIKTEKTVNITFNKKPRIIERYLMIKD